MKKILIACLLLTGFLSFSQNVTKLISEKNVSRVLKTLSSDAMMGRPSMVPGKMEMATSFIENEFREIGLSPLSGLSTFRQEFTKEKISFENLQVIIDGKTISPNNILIVSERRSIAINNGLPVKYLLYDSTASDLEEDFVKKASPFMRDTTSGLMLIDPRFEKYFKEVQHRYSMRFLNNRKYTKVLVLAKATAASYAVKATAKTEIIKMANVVGRIEGKTKPEEVVVFSGHYDHLGIQPSVSGDSIANGADDDASGTTGVIELARYFKKIRNNARTLIFVAFTAEEIGGYGSRYFSEQLDPEKVVAMFNIEMIGKPSKWGQQSAFITGYERSDFGSILEKNLSGTKFSFKPDPYPAQNLFYRSDNATLARLGVPAHTISTDQIDSDKLYHTVDDEFESMDIANVTSTIRAIALSSRSIVNGTDTPTRIDKTSVK